MVYLRRCFLMLVLLLAGAGQGWAAPSAETHAYDAAAKAFRAGFWNYANKRFGEFVKDYPKSPHAPEAILFQARARYNLGRFDQVVSLLSRNVSNARMWQDDYLYWIAQAHFRSGNYESAAVTFAKLIKQFPNSPQCLDSAVGEATALARLGNWSAVVKLLQQPKGVFRRGAAATPTSPSVVLGYLLLGEAQLAQKDYPGVEATLDWLSKQKLDRELSWRRQYLQCRLLLAEGKLKQTLQNTTNLLTLAGAAMAPVAHGTNSPSAITQILASYAAIPSSNLRSESWAFRAQALEKLNHFDQAIDAYTNNLTTNAPVEQQRQALLKIAELSLAQNKADKAIKTLEDFWKQYPHSRAADMVLLATGELQLKLGVSQTNSAAANAATNLVSQALERFDRLLNTFTNSPLRGKALLDKGWCLWEEQRYAPSEQAFRQAAELLPVSRNQAVARFKWADAQFKRKDYAGAITNYEYLVKHYGAGPGIRGHLFEQALYQTVRAALAANDLSVATNALQKILKWYPNGFAGPHCLLLVGQGLVQEKDPAGARKLFAEFERRYPTNSLLPEVQMARARTYEEAGDWHAAIRQYTAWIKRFTNHVELPRAEFRRAWDYSMSGNETNALALFENVTKQFPTNELAQQARWWIGDYYFNNGDYANAEYNYQLVFKSTNWMPSVLSYQAQMMAGRAAVARLRYKDAVAYFTALSSNSNCPPGLATKAQFAWGDAEMNLDSGDTNVQANLNTAISIFGQIAPTNQMAPLAWGRIADCYFQLAATDPTKYTDAAKYYRRVVNSPRASVQARSQAQVGLGLVAEQLAVRKTGAERTALLQEALDDYLDVFFEHNLRNGEKPDQFWLKKAGLEAARLAEALQRWKPAIAIYQKLENLLPPMRSALQNKILKAESNERGENN